MSAFWQTMPSTNVVYMAEKGLKLKSESVMHSYFSSVTLPLHCRVCYKINGRYLVSRNYAKESLCHKNVNVLHDAHRNNNGHNLRKKNVCVSPTVSLHVFT